MRFLSAIAIFCLFFQKNHAQNRLFMPLNIQAAYEKGTRSLDGSPGKSYWQNRAEYAINVALDPKKRLVSGSEDVTYFNNSPDTLDMIRLKLQHDLYKKGGQRNRDIAASDVTDEGVKIKDVFVNGEALPGMKQRRHESFHDLRLEKKLSPGNSLRLKIVWEFTMPADPEATRECVCDPTTFFIPYFYPQIAVYDDLQGWASAPYNGLQEFYHDFADYNVTISLPTGYMAWATGEWQNPADVLTPETLEKWERAHKATDVTPIFTEAELKAGTALKKNAKNVFRFRAENVPDFTFAVSDHYNWDATSVVADPETGQRVFVSAVYDSKSGDFPQVASIAAEGINLMVNYLPGYPFPYPTMTVFNGNDAMEYPMMVNDASVPASFVHELTIHEVSHTYFPFMMGTNEQYYAWMDEGWANFFETYICDSLLHRKGWALAYGHGAGKDWDVPPMVPTRYLSGAAFSIHSYSRPQTAYMVLLDLLGYQTFTKCLHEYMNRWSGKHPQPFDFFHTFNQASGQDLNWFWKPFFFDYGYPDLGIKKVETDKDAGRQVVVVENRGTMPMPIFLSVEYSDGDRENFHFKADIWKNGDSMVRVPCSRAKVVKSVKLGDSKTPDAKTQDNSFLVN